MSRLPEGVESLEVPESWADRVFTVSPLIVVGTCDEDGGDDLAPKHMATHVGYDGYFAFACTPSHQTYWNCKREEGFAVSYPRPSQVVLASLAATPREEETAAKPIVAAIPTFPATVVAGPLVRDAYLYLECRLDRILDGFGDASLIVGKVVAAHAASDALRRSDRDDQEIIRGEPLMAYLDPGRYTAVDASRTFPFPDGFRQDR